MCLITIFEASLQKACVCKIFTPHYIGICNRRHTCPSGILPVSWPLSGELLVLCLETGEVGAAACWVTSLGRAWTSAWKEQLHGKHTDLAPSPLTWVLNTATSVAVYEIISSKFRRLTTKCVQLFSGSHLCLGNKCWHIWYQATIN